jgi:hypothetical protein
MLEDSSSAGWYFTAPLDPPPRRRGDALGLRGLADRFADALAPGLSNATIDARWVTLLAWSLQASHEVWARAEHDDLRRREAQQRRYAWLRPLELLWVTWALRTQERPAGRQLPGQRSVRRWLSDEARPAHFGMRPEQYRRFRQTGIYGAYRTLFRRIPALTLGERGSDGWTPGAGTNALFRFVNSELPRSLRFSDAVLDRSTRWSRWADQEDRWWMERGWGVDALPGFHLFPSEGGTAKRLPPEERDLLSPQLFPAGSRRRLVAQLLAEVPSGSRHEDLCRHLARAGALRGTESGPLLVSLPDFTRLADAGMDAIRAVWAGICRSTDARGPTVADLASDTNVLTSLQRLEQASVAWAANTASATVPHGVPAAALAQTMTTTRSPSERLRALARHHETHGGGLRWFRLQGGRLEPRLPHNMAAASDYRFRLWPLARLAMQCGVADTRAALEAATGGNDERTEEE